MKPPTGVPPSIALDRAPRRELHRQLYDAVRVSLLDGRLPARTRRPYMRALAEELGVSRSTVVEAFRQLSAEGYTEGEVGSGTRVSDTLPAENSNTRHFDE